MTPYEVRRRVRGWASWARFMVRAVTYVWWRLWLHSSWFLPCRVRFGGASILRRCVYWARDLNGGQK